MKSLKTILLVLLLSLLGEATALAVPAYNRKRTVLQPDGTTLTIIGRGDEFCHFLTTTDGYTILKSNDGFYRYADLKGGKLVTGPVRAFDSDKRMSSEINYLSTKEKFLAPALTPAAKSLKSHASKRNDFLAAKRLRKVAGSAREYRGLVILVNYTDRTFSRGNKSANSFYNRMMNSSNFKRDLDTRYGVQVYTGSMRDYFSDNSDGKFAPEFDVIGPIDIDVSQRYINGITNAYDLASKVLRTADAEIDYSKYDSDGDGELDMVYMVYAGYSSHYMDNDESYIWPHAGSMNDDESTDRNLTLDGIRMGRFAASAEIFGWEDDKDLYLDGIGVMVHEFSHVLGFQDHYDSTDGYQEHPNTWDVMSAGCYSDNYNRTPVAYNSYEKYAAGFLQPLNLTDMAGETVSLKSTETSNDACVIRSYQDNVFYIMENRQQDKWDKYMLGHGLLVWRVDSTVVEYWEKNLVNVTTRACFRLVRACGTQGSFFTGVEDTPYDPFPGTHNITELDNDEDMANLVSYDGYPCPVVLRDITEKDGIISFRIEKDDYARNEPMTFTMPSRLTAKAERQVGDEWEPATWTVATVNNDGAGYFTNLIPNNAGITMEGKDYSRGISVSYTKSAEKAHNLVVSAQRVALSADYGTWLCNLTDVYSSGTGFFSLTLDRYGIPTLDDPATQLSFCKLAPKAYMVSQKNLLGQLDVYRNITFTDYNGQEDSLHDLPSSDSQGAGEVSKRIDGNRIIIVKNGKNYTTAGVQVE